MKITIELDDDTARAVGRTDIMDVLNALGHATLRTDGYALPDIQRHLTFLESRVAKIWGAIRKEIHAETD